MDSRIDPLAALEAVPGEINVLRNAGGIVTEDILRSLLISQRQLGTNQILVMMHTDCRMAGLDEEKERNSIELATGMKLPFALGAFHHLEAQVHASVKRIRETKYLPHRDHVSGAVYDVDSRQLRTIVA
jgi:carbonic anhydrase